MVYDGSWKEDKPHGKGTETYKDGSNYVGDFVKGKKEGFGTFTWSDGRVYTGEFKEGYMHGKGKLSINKSGRTMTCNTPPTWK